MKRSLPAVALYLIIYALSIAHLSSVPEFEAGESIAVFLIFGIGFSILAWVATIGIQPGEVVVRKPAQEFGTILIYLVIFAVLFLGWGLSAIRESFQEARIQSVAIILAKILTMVILPAILFLAFGYSLRQLFGARTLDRPGWRAALVMTILLFLLQALLGRGLQTLSDLGPPIHILLFMAPLALIWFCIEAGLTEEFLFRVLLQTRASAWLRSEIAGILVMSILFGLAHAPGYVLRGQHLMEGMQTAPDPLTAAAYSIAVVSPIGLMFGVLWHRTRNLWLIVFLHGWTDLLPNLAEFIETFGPQASRLP
jgi:membrane protease YdiL (CAAX protease family)